MGDRFFWRRMIKEEYTQYLNRMKVFVLANDSDKGFFMKHLETMACGCLLLAEYTPLLDTLGFVDEEHLLVWYNLRECENKALYYLAHDEERLRITSQAKEKVKECTWQYKVDELLDWVCDDADSASRVH